MRRRSFPFALSIALPFPAMAQLGRDCVASGAVRHGKALREVNVGSIELAAPLSESVRQ